MYSEALSKGAKDLPFWERMIKKDVAVTSVIKPGQLDQAQRAPCNAKYDRMPCLPKQQEQATANHAYGDASEIK